MIIYTIYNNDDNDGKMMDGWMDGWMIIYN